MNAAQTPSGCQTASISARATEALRAVVSFRAVVSCSYEIFGLNRIAAWTLPGNGASDRVLEKGGFRCEGTLRQKAHFKD
jgi:RimJ/RimL family protein N-acetyltransferase